MVVLGVTTRLRVFFTGIGRGVEAGEEDEIAAARRASRRC